MCAFSVLAAVVLSEVPSHDRERGLVLVVAAACSYMLGVPLAIWGVITDLIAAMRRRERSWVTGTFFALEIGYLACGPLYSYWESRTFTVSVMIGEGGAGWVDSYYGEIRCSSPPRSGDICRANLRRSLYLTAHGGNHLWSGACDHAKFDEHCQAEMDGDTSVGITFSSQTP